MISKLALGTVQFGMPYGISNKHGRIAINEISKILDTAHEYGIAILDTAIAYGDSESVIGESLEQKPYSFKIITKISANEDVNLQVDCSLKRLRQKKLYGVLFHDTDTALNSLSSINKLDKLKNDGLIQKVGYSLYHPNQLIKLFDLGVKIDLVQIPFNILDQRFKPYFKELKDRDVEINVRSVFLQGIFFLNPDKLDSKFDEIKVQIKNIHQISNQEGISVGTMALGFAAINENIDHVVVGIESLKNLQDNLVSIRNLDKVKVIENKLLKLDCNNNDMILPTNWK